MDKALDAAERRGLQFLVQRWRSQAEGHDREAKRLRGMAASAEGELSEDKARAAGEAKRPPAKLSVPVGNDTKGLPEKCTAAEAAAIVLWDKGKPTHIKKIIREMIRRQFPSDETRLFNALRGALRRNADDVFYKDGSKPATYGLREWQQGMSKREEAPELVPPAPLAQDKEGA